MNIIETITESKRRTNIANGITIDWKYAQTIINSISPAIGTATENTPEFIEQAKALAEILLNIRTGIDELLLVVPQTVRE